MWFNMYRAETELLYASIGRHMLVVDVCSNTPMSAHSQARPGSPSTSEFPERPLVMVYTRS